MDNPAFLKKSITFLIITTALAVLLRITVHAHFSFSISMCAAFLVMPGIIASTNLSNIKKAVFLSLITISCFLLTLISTNYNVKLICSLLVVWLIVLAVSIIKYTTKKQRSH